MGEESCLNHFFNLRWRLVGLSLDLDSLILKPSLLTEQGLFELAMVNSGRICWQHYYYGVNMDLLVLFDSFKAGWAVGQKCASATLNVRLAVGSLEQLDAVTKLSFPSV